MNARSIESIVTDDAQLVIAARAGDREAFGQLVDRYQRSARASCWAILKDSHHAADAAQDAFLAAYRSLNNLRDPSLFGSWLIAIARNRALRLGRSIGRDVQISSALPDQRATEIQPDVELLNAIASLPEHERLVLMLRYFEQMEVAEIAVVLRRPLGTVTKQISRAHDRLRRLLTPKEKD